MEVSYATDGSILADGTETHLADGEKKKQSNGLFVHIAFFRNIRHFGLYPIIFTLYLSLFRWDALWPMKYVGLQNFKFVVEDPIFWTSFTNTLLISAMGTIPQLMLALVLADS